LQIVIIENRHLSACVEQNKFAGTVDTELRHQMMPLYKVAYIF